MKMEFNRELSDKMIKFAGIGGSALAIVLLVSLIITGVQIHGYNKKAADAGFKNMYEAVDAVTGGAAVAGMDNNEIEDFEDMYEDAVVSDSEVVGEFNKFSINGQSIVLPALFSDIEKCGLHFAVDDIATRTISANTVLPSEIRDESGENVIGYIEVLNPFDAEKQGADCYVTGFTIGTDILMNGVENEIPMVTLKDSDKGVGSSREEIRELFGAPSETEDATEEDSLSYDSWYLDEELLNDIIIGYSQDNKVVFIQIDSPGEFDLSEVAYDSTVMDSMTGFQDFNESQLDGMDFMEIDESEFDDLEVDDEDIDDDDIDDEEFDESDEDYDESDDDEYYDLSGDEDIEYDEIIDEVEE